jgi:prepilin-type N-terminal cleavage/methylation domain-containing protein
MKPNRPVHPPRRPAARSGFTLLELVAVIGIISIMAIVVVGGFNGIVRAISGDTGVSAITRALNLARQQACIDGKPVYVWVTGLDSYVLVRKSGTISDRNTETRSFEWGTGRSLDNLGNGKALWLFDSYADLAAAGINIPFDDSYTEDAVRYVFDQYKGILVFDMTEGGMANVVVPPMYAPGADAWVFGVDRSDAGSKFKKGSDYGWLVLPVQYLPKGYVFDGSFDDGTGAFKKDYDKKVCFNPSGSPDKETEFPILETATGKTGSVKVSGSGKITVEKVK